MDDPEDNLEFVRRTGDGLYLFNHSDETLKRIRVADKLVHTELESVYSSPLYEIEELPPRTYVPLPTSSEGLEGAQFWDVKVAEWSGGRRVEETLYPEEKRWGAAEFSETRVDRNVRHLGTIPSHRLGEEPTELTDPGTLYTQKLAVYRDTDRTLYLINGAEVGADCFHLRCYHYWRDEWRWPEDKSGAEAKMLRIGDVPPTSYVALVSGFDSNKERFEFEAVQVDRADGETFEGPLELPLTNPVRSAPLGERELSRKEREVEWVEM
jgi:hypothetical protein